MNDETERSLGVSGEFDRDPQRLAEAFGEISAIVLPHIGHGGDYQLIVNLVQRLANIAEAAQRWYDASDMGELHLAVDQLKAAVRERA